METIKIEQNGISLFFEVEVQESGMNQNAHHGCKHISTSPAMLFETVNVCEKKNLAGKKIEIVQAHENLFCTTHLQFYDEASVVRAWTVLENKSNEVRPLEYVSSLCLANIEGFCDECERDKKKYVWIPHSTWYGENQWKRYSMNDLGYYVVNEHSMKRIALCSTGTWACAEYLPMGSFENESNGTTFTWQIETSVSWGWEICDHKNHLYLHLSGPAFQENGWTKKLKPGEVFESVPAALAFVKGDFEKSIKELTKYRRLIRRKCFDNENPSVIFNDYMNCLWGDATSEKLIPLIDAAQKAGAHYFCIDCGWYDDGPWWDGVGEWMPAKNRFKGGIKKILDYIRKKGMIPGLWIEAEVMGIKCPLAKKVSDDWFFKRNGKVVVDEARYQLDYRNGEVRDFMDGVFDRLVKEYGALYIKIDYNINGGAGTETNADSIGEGLLQHSRAYLSWLEGVLVRYPNLVVENCSSGGMRMEYSMLSRCAVQSVTDQTDYIKMAAIAANAPAACAPEQAAIWSYPLKDGDKEEVAFNMVNAILMRIHQSGNIADLSEERFSIVREGIELHKKISCALAKGLPFWPLGMANFESEFVALGIDTGEKKYLAVWHTKGKNLKKKISLKKYVKNDAKFEMIFPKKMPVPFEFDGETLCVEMKEKTARLFKIE